MVYKFETKRAGTGHYYIGYRLISENGTPDYILEYPRPPKIEPVGPNKKLQYAFIANPHYNATLRPGPGNRPFSLIRAPQALDIREREQSAARERRKKIQRIIKTEDLLGALILLADGDVSGVKKLQERIQ